MNNQVCAAFFNVRMALQGNPGPGTGHSGGGFNTASHVKLTFAALLLGSAALMLRVMARHGSHASRMKAVWLVYTINQVFWSFYSVAGVVAPCNAALERRGYGWADASRR